MAGVLTLKLTVAPRLTDMSVAKPWIVLSPTPVTSHSLGGLPVWQFSTTTALEPAGAGHAAWAAGASVSQPAANPIATTAHTSHCRAPVRVSAPSRPDSMTGQRSGVLAARAGGKSPPTTGGLPSRATAAPRARAGTQSGRAKRLLPAPEGERERVPRRPLGMARARDRVRGAGKAAAGELVGERAQDVDVGLPRVARTLSCDERLRRRVVCT